MRRGALALAGAWCLASALPAQARPPIGGAAAHARASIEAVQVGDRSAQVLVTMHVDPGWHISWRNPGETGLPTTLRWSLPAGVSVTGEQWPVPVVTHTPVAVTHTLEGDVPWLVTLRTPATPPTDRIVGLTLRFGICREICIPGQLVVQGELPVAGARVVPVPGAARARLATDAGVIGGRRRSRTELCLDRLPAGLAAAEVIADSGTGIDPALTPRRSGGRLLLSIPATASLPTASHLLFVHGATGASARLDLRAPAPGCTRR